MGRITVIVLLAFGLQAHATDTYNDETVKLVSRALGGTDLLPDADLDSTTLGKEWIENLSTQGGALPTKTRTQYIPPNERNAFNAFQGFQGKPNPAARAPVRAASKTVARAPPKPVAKKAPSKPAFSFSFPKPAAKAPPKPVAKKAPSKPAFSFSFPKPAAKAPPKPVAKKAPAKAIAKKPAFSFSTKTIAKPPAKKAAPPKKAGFSFFGKAIADEPSPVQPGIPPLRQQFYGNRFPVQRPVQAPFMNQQSSSLSHWR